MDSFSFFDKLHSHVIQSFIEHRNMHENMMNSVRICHSDTMNYRSGNVIRPSNVIRSKSNENFNNRQLNAKKTLIISQHDTLAKEGILPQRIQKPSYSDCEQNVQRNRSVSSGWSEVTKAHEGQMTLYGKYTIIESKSFNKPYLCLYEPIVYKDAMKTNRFYDLQLSVKAIRSSNCPTSFIEIVIGFVNSDHYYILRADIFNQNWFLLLINNENLNSTPIILFTYEDRSLKLNHFIDILIKVNFKEIEVIKDKTFLFNYNIPHAALSNTNNTGATFQGSIGFIVRKNAKIAFKDWKFKSYENTVISMIPQHNPNTATVSSLHVKENRPRSSHGCFYSRTQSQRHVNRNSNLVTDNRSLPLSKKNTHEVLTSTTAEAVERGSNLVSKAIHSHTNNCQKCTQLLSNQFEKSMIDAICADIIENEGMTDNHAISRESNDIINTTSDTNLKVNANRLQNLVALDTPKQAINEAIILPLLLPEFFTGLRQPWKGILLYGPPGVGKTLLAKAISQEHQITFINCSSATLISKWRGDSEKLIKCLFAVCRVLSPSLLFIDEIDSLMSSREGSGSNDSSDSRHEHEASRRMKTEFLTQIDGVPTMSSTPTLNTNISSSGNSSSISVSPARVIVLGATNIPWSLDLAMLRRFEKRIYIGLPNLSERKEIFQLKLKSMEVEECIDIDNLASITNNYSGSDIHTVCMEAAYAPLRRMMSTINNDRDIGSDTATVIQGLRNSGQLHIPKILNSDLLNAVASVKPAVPLNLIKKYESWNNEFGSA